MNFLPLLVEGSPAVLRAAETALHVELRKAADQMAAANSEITMGQAQGYYRAVREILNAVTTKLKRGP